MKLVPCEIDKLGYEPRRSTKLYRLLTEFANGNADCVRLEGWTNKSARTCVNSIQLSINRYYKGLIHVFERDGEVYLVKAKVFKN